MKLNNRGIMLMEAVAYMAILTIVVYVGLTFLNFFNASLRRSQVKANQITQQVNNAISQYATIQQVEAAKPRWFWVDVPTLNQCKKADAQYWIARTASRTVTLYTTSNCASNSSIGTLNATDNSRFTNKTTKTLWEVSGDTSTLTVQLIVFP